MDSEKDLTVVLNEAAALAAELAGEIGEPVSPALAGFGTGPADSEETAPLEAAADLDAQLANLQLLVDDAAAGVESPPDTSDAGPEGRVPASPTAAPTSGSVADDTSPRAETDAIAGDAADGAKPDGPTGVVGNMPNPPPLEPPPPVQKPAAVEETKVSPTVPPARRFRATLLAIALAAGDACTRFLELIDEPFQFVGGRLRVVIGWLALATVGASVLVAILAMLL